MGSQARRKVGFEQYEAEVYSEMDRMDALGYSLIPLGGGDDGKSPTMKFSGRGKIPRQDVWDRMWQTKSLMYGVRLDKLVVVDLDTSTPDSFDYLRRRFGTASVEVLTRRGRHLWFKVGTTPVPSNVRDPGIAIDIKSGKNSYVVGPLSVRPDDGFIYRYDGDGFDRRPRLIPFTDRTPPVTRAAVRGREGERHEFMRKKATEYAWTASTQEGLIADLIGIRDWQIEDPASFPDAEVIGLAEWAWKLRLDNKLYAGRESEVKIRRSTYDSLLKLEHGCEALALYTVLVGAHEHVRGKLFSIVAPAMRRDGLINLSDKKIWRARDTLMEQGFLIRRKRGRGPGSPDEFQLSRPGSDVSVAA